MDKNNNYFEIEIGPTGVRKAESRGIEVKKSKSGIEIDFAPLLSEPTKISLNKNCVELEVDSMGLTPVFFRVSSDIIFISSHISRIPKLQNNSLAIEPIKQLMNNGIITSDKTIWSGITKVNPNFKYIINTKTPPFSLLRKLKQYQVLSMHPNLDTLIDNLYKSLKKIINQSQSGLFALSGGADSRLLLALMDSVDRKSMTFYTKANPMLDQKNDKDLQISSSLAKKLALNHKVVDRPKLYLAFLVPEFTSGKPISGLYGGEILGGIQPNSTGMSFHENIFSREWVLNIINSSRTMVYNQTDYGWASPYSFSYFTDTPFLNSNFLRSLFEFANSEIEDYQLYSKIWEKTKFTDFLELPFSSPICSKSPIFKALDGQDPKSTPAPYSLKTSESSEFSLQLSEIIGKENIKKNAYKNLKFYVQQTANYDPYNLL